APEIGPNSKHREQFLRRGGAIHQLRLAVACPCKREKRNIFGNTSERPGLLVIIKKIWSGSRDVRGTVSIRSGPNRVKALGIRKGQAFNQNVMYNAEHRGIGADTECKSDNSNDGKSG